MSSQQQSSSSSHIPSLLHQLISKSISNSNTQQSTYKLCLRLLQTSFPTMSDVNVREKIQQDLHMSHQLQDLEWITDIFQKLDQIAPQLSHKLATPNQSIQKMIQLISQLADLKLNYAPENAGSASASGTANARRFIYAENDAGVFQENDKDLMTDEDDAQQNQTPLHHHQGGGANLNARRQAPPPSGGDSGMHSPIVRRQNSNDWSSGHSRHHTRSDSPVMRYNNFTQPPQREPSYQAQKYTEFEAERGIAFEVGEDILLRDVIYALQGVDGAYIKYDYTSDGYLMDRSVGCPSATRDMIRKICELGWLFRRVKAFVDETSAEPRRGLALQSFCSAINKQLTEYYKLIAVLESHIKSQASRNQLSLRRLLVWTMDPISRLRTLLQLIEQCKNQKGGKLADVVYIFTTVGDPFVRSFTTHVLQEVCTPLYNMIQSWIMDGDLQDPFGEFFIIQERDVPNEQLWQRKYRLKRDMLPSFISAPLGEKILRIGKSINFLKFCCNDTQWHMDTRLITAERLNVERIDELEAIVDNCAEMADRRVMEIIYSDKFGFFQHMMALKKFFLVGQGDFINYLLRLVSDELSKAAHSIDRYTLPTMLDSAIKNSNAQYDDEAVTACLYVSVDSQSQSSSNAGWDSFKLEYRPPDPISTIFSQSMLNAYLKIFQFLWHIKRVERDLNSAWKKQISLTRRIARSTKFSELSKVLHPCNLLRHEMDYFINNLQYFLMFEVIESNWNELLERTKELKQKGNLDQLIEIHQKFPFKIIQNTFLDEDSTPVLNHIRKIFRLVHQFIQIQNMVNHTVLHILQQETLLQDDMIDVDLEEENQRQAQLQQEQRDLQKLTQKLQLSKKQYDLLFAELLKMKLAQRFVKVFKIKM
uniref:Spindle pole body component n=1 Tax=Percolomonas cosmopolitus TaxID=63605 RepID=A0A7S1KPF2_9EUKA|mmetsp:Transcript_398/g.1517  ORF Transcript_398/g.1517 Transcript_398/m.1517 type:complete len:874 (+) Transcript_398:136-2757(+)|eukprot:CAMPEP_0117449644 /NCGR_PEP_ID=MMETSP0759-20121206/8050_1 /TAXON_ID=63605 /ORGANISM="Percolomonas cosmopolitus, Strain WS" /LENGTH=873 /DNA_ID=CAMNT_0005242123 /DNA_START=9 /DNA_END=2630 /DNA_ORIENTATION=-